MSEPITEKWSKLDKIAEHLGLSKDNIYRTYLTIKNWRNTREWVMQKTGRSVILP